MGTVDASFGVRKAPVLHARDIQAHNTLRQEIKEAFTELMGREIDEMPKIPHPLKYPAELQGKEDTDADVETHGTKFLYYSFKLFALARELLKILVEQYDCKWEITETSVDGTLLFKSCIEYKGDRHFTTNETFVGSLTWIVSRLMVEIKK